MIEHVIPQIPADKWKDLGTLLLKGNTAELSHIKDNASTIQERLSLLFEKWLRECHAEASWDRLIYALEKIQLNHLAQTLKAMLKKTAGKGLL